MSSFFEDQNLWILILVLFLLLIIVLICLERFPSQDPDEPMQL